MMALLPLPRLAFGAGAIAALPNELTGLAVERPLLISDRGLERAGTVAVVRRLLAGSVALYLDVPENPTAAAADAAYAAYRDGRCDGVVALGGGSVIDTAKMVAALAAGGARPAIELIGRPDLIGPDMPPLVAIPTTIGTGSESSPVSALHAEPGRPAVGTRGPRLVPRVAICDPDLARTLPRRLIAATGIDALSHCLEGYFAEPANPIVDAIALDGLARAFADLRAATEPDGDAARASMMAAAFAGGAAIHKGLGPAHAVALSCGDQDLHHGALIAAVLPAVIGLVASHVPVKAARIAATLGLRGPQDLVPALASLIEALGLPPDLRAAGYRARSIDALVETIVASPFNRTSAYVPTPAEYRSIVGAVQA